MILLLITDVDDVAPVITGTLNDVTVYIASAGDAPVTVTWTAPTASDDSGMAPGLTNTHNPGDAFPIGNTMVSYTATDAAGNKAVVSFTVMIILGRYFCLSCKVTRSKVLVTFGNHRVLLVNGSQLAKKKR